MERGPIRSPIGIRPVREGSSTVDEACEGVDKIFIQLIKNNKEQSSTDEANPANLQGSLKSRREGKSREAWREGIVEEKSQ
jgi:hypothetical protein